MRRGILWVLMSVQTLAGMAQIMHGNDDKQFRLFDAGFIGGLNFTQIHGDNLAGFNKLGVQAGAIAHINFNPEWSLAFEVLYTQKGSSTAPDPNNFNPNELKIRLDYTEIPVLINYNDQNRIIFSAGVAYGRLLRAEREENGLFVDGFEESMNATDLSYVLGGTILVGESRHVGLNFRYQQSFIRVGPSTQPNVPGLINVVLSLRAIYYI